MLLTIREHRGLARGQPFRPGPARARPACWCPRWPAPAWSWGVQDNPAPGLHSRRHPGSHGRGTALCPLESWPHAQGLLMVSCQAERPARPPGCLARTGSSSPAAPRPAALCPSPVRASAREPQPWTPSPLVKKTAGQSAESLASAASFPRAGDEAGAPGHAHPVRPALEKTATWWQRPVPGSDRVPQETAWGGHERSALSWPSAGCVGSDRVCLCVAKGPVHGPHVWPAHQAGLDPKPTRRKRRRGFSSLPEGWKLVSCRPEATWDSWPPDSGLVSFCRTAPDAMPRPRPQTGSDPTAVSEAHLSPPGLSAFLAPWAVVTPSCPNR